MTDANTLTPCPFCGERAETYFIPERHSYQIECSDVFGCTARVTRDSEEAAIEAWNRRAPAAALPPELSSIAKQASIAAAEVTAPSGPAREPLSQERLQFLSGEYEDIPEEGVAFRDGWRSAEMHHGITAAQKGGQHGF